MLCLSAGLLAGLLLSSSSPPKPSALFFSGLFSALVFVCKQNFGLAALLAFLLWFLINPLLRRSSAFIIYLFGYLSCISLFLFCLFITGSLPAYFHDLYYFTYDRIFRSGVLNSSWPWQFSSSLPAVIGKIALYLSPLLISVIAFFRLLQLRTSHLLIFPLLSIFYYLLSIRPTTDQVHLTPLIALSLLSLALLTVNASRTVKIFLTVSFLPLLLLGAYSATFRNYYRWEAPLYTQTAFLSHSRVNLWVSPDTAVTVNRLTDFFSSTTAPQAPLFVYDYAPVFYLLLDKTNPTRHDYVQPGVTTPKVEMEIITSLQSTPVIHLLTHDNPSPASTAITAFIDSAYHPVFRQNQYLVWEKN
jgi:hypothetical protein